MGAYPRSLTKKDWRTAAGREPASGGFGNAMSRQGTAGSRLSSRSLWEFGRLGIAILAEVN
jgi:hypothetical protein